MNFDLPQDGGERKFICRHCHPSLSNSHVRGWLSRDDLGLKK
jgi:hypothetical protein